VRFAWRKESVNTVSMISIHTGRAFLTNEMQLLMEPVAWLDMLSNAGRLGTSIWGDVNGSNEDL
jgi:hypothetical protein